MSEPNHPAITRAHPAPGVACLTLARPAARNALSLEMIEALSDALARCADNAAVRVVILASDGPAFCAGHDLRELTTARAAPDGGRAFYEKTFAACGKLMQAVVSQPQPVIAAVEGVATAAGCQLVASCDLAIAGEAATFCTPGVDIGLFCSTPAVALARNVGRKHAMEMLLTGAFVPARDALAMGLVNRVVPAGGARDAALALARKIAEKPAATIRSGKQTFNAQLARPLPEAYDIAARAMVEAMLAPDAKEGIGAFIDKRAPKWH